MAKFSADVLVVPGEGVFQTEGLTEKAVQRMDTAIAAWEEGIAPNIAVTGYHSFLLRQPPVVSQAAWMERYAQERGVPVFTEKQALETVGNALFTKTEIVLPHGWESLILVPSESYEERSVAAFRHVYGPDFEIRSLPAPERIGAKEKVWEAIGSVIVREILRGTEPGDHVAIKKRLFELVPGYDEASFKHLAFASLTGLFKRS